MREPSRVGTSSFSRVFNLQKRGQAPGPHYEFILWGAGFCLILPSAVCLNLGHGGDVLGNGTWANVGGNQAVTYGGATALTQNGDPRDNDAVGGSIVSSCLVQYQGNLLKPHASFSEFGTDIFLSE
jgi:hypothetical protein